jgi:hypothetical protein
MVACVILRSEVKILEFVQNSYHSVKNEIGIMNFWGFCFQVKRFYILALATGIVQYKIDCKIHAHFNILSFPYST